MGNPVWNRIDRELSRRKRVHQRPATWAALGRLVGASKQTTTNWKTRGVPPKEHEALANALGWSVDELLYGDDETASADAHETPAPYGPIVARNHLERELLTAFRYIPSQDRERYAAAIVADAEKQRGFVAEILREQYGVTGYASDERVLQALPKLPRSEPAPVERPAAPSAAEQVDPQLVEDLRLLAIELSRFPDAAARHAAVAVGKVAIGRLFEKATAKVKTPARASNAPAAQKPKR